jgi:hypothetical protein
MRTIHRETQRCLVASLLGVICLAGGCRHRPLLVGTWEGAPQTQEVIHQTTKGQANPVAEGFVNAAAQGLANAFLAVRLELKPDGTGYYSGATGALGLPPASSGPWYVISEQGDSYRVRLGTGSRAVEANLVFHDKNKFTLTRKEAPDTPIVFSRVE